MACETRRFNFGIPILIPVSLRSILTSSSHQRLRITASLPFTFSKALLPSPILAICPAHLNLVDLITLTILGECIVIIIIIIIILIITNVTLAHRVEGGGRIKSLLFFNYTRSNVNENVSINLMYIPVSPLQVMELLFDIATPSLLLIKIY